MGSDKLGIDPEVAELADNGGQLETNALLPGSPAIDAGSNTGCAASPINNVDERGIARPTDGNGDTVNVCDIGAYELPAALVGTATPTVAGPLSLVVNTLDDIYIGSCRVICSLRDAVGWQLMAAR